MQYPRKYTVYGYIRKKVVTYLSKNSNNIYLKQNKQIKTKTNYNANMEIFLEVIKNKFFFRLNVYWNSPISIHVKTKN